MPFYEYSCPKCGMKFDLLRAMADRDKPTLCPGCGAAGARRELPLVQARSRSEGVGGGCGAGGGAFT
jgi:putative FmdB family regulatory protein